MPAGRISHDEAGPDLAAADVVLGAGWGNTATKVVEAGSNDMAGRITVTSAGTGQAQATATIAVTFKRPLGFVPVVVAGRGGGSAVNSVFPKVTAVSETGFTIVSNTLPVAAETTEFVYTVS